MNKGINVKKYYFSKVYLVLVLILIGISSFLPSGFIFGFPLKHLVFLLVLSALIMLLILNDTFKISKSFKVLFYFSLMVVLILFLLMSTFGEVNFKFIFEDFKFIFLTFMFFSLVELARYTNMLSFGELYHSVFKWSFYGIFLFCISKVLLIFLLLFNVIDYAFVKNVIFPAINYEPVGLQIELIGSRFSFITLDMLSVIIFIYLIFDKNIIINNKLKYIYYVFFFISLFSAYSRFLFMIVPLMTFVALLLNRSYKSVITISIIVLIMAFLNIDLIASFIEHRFLHQEHSDSYREEMIINLSSYWEEGILLGHGFGSYVPWYIRSEDMPFSYEVQLLSIIMRFGVFPILLLLWMELVLFLYHEISKQKDIFFFLVV